MKILFIISAVLYTASLLVVSVNITAGEWLYHAAIAAVLIGAMVRFNFFSRAENTDK